MNYNSPSRVQEIIDNYELLMHYYLHYFWTFVYVSQPMGLSYRSPRQDFPKEIISIAGLVHNVTHDIK